jgi:UDP-N-acetylmuramoyl-L-alanyl-D-glutamate--2,6-diaminopimelate ligase
MTSNDQSHQAAGGSWNQLLESVRNGRPVRLHSKAVQPGDVFVALPGKAVDGSRFIPDALSRGAAWIVSASDRNVPEDSLDRLIVRDDPQAGLGQLAKASFGTEAQTFLLVGITGTNGKTTVAAMLEELFQAAGRSVGIVGTVNYRWPGHEEAARLTTPDCLTTHSLLARMAQDGVDVVCMEVSSHALDQQRVAGLDFDLAVFTNLSQDHLDYHEDMEAYYLAKRRLFDPVSGPAPRPVINLDDEYGTRLAAELENPLGYSLGKARLASGSILQAEIRSASRRGLELAMQYQDQSWQLSSPIIGRHNAANLAAAQAAGLAAGLPSTAMSALNGFPGVAGRLEKIDNARDLHIFVDYAHSPDALENVLASVRGLDFRRLVVVFGCGGDRDKTKRPLMGQAVAAFADVAVLTSDNPRHEDPAAIMNDVLPGIQGQIRLIQEADRRKAIGLALDELTPDDALIIAGKGHEDYQEIGGERFPYSDFAAVREHLKSCR